MKQNIRKRFLSLILATTMIMGLAGCSSKEEDIPYSFDEILTEFSSDTNIDELMKVGNQILIKTGEESTEEVDFLTSVKELEERVAFSDKLEAEKIGTLEIASDELKELYGDLSLEEAEILFESLKDENLTPVAKERIKAGLAYLATENKDWIKNNGLNISEELLKRVVKAGACEISGLEVDYYSNCIIDPTNKESDYLGNLVVSDPVSGATLEYGIPRNGNVMSDAVSTLYNIQGLDNPSYKEIISYCESALETSKLAVAAGVELDGNKVDSELKSKDAKKLILEKKAPSTTEQEG